MTKKKTVKRLTPKQEAFAFKYAETGDAALSYRAAYNTGKMKEGTIWTEGYRLTIHPQVALKITEIRVALAEKNAVTVDSVTKMLKVSYHLAVQKEQTGASVQAAMGLAKLNGLLVEKSDSVVKVTVETSYA